MIKFSNGHELLFANGSGALAFDGRGWWWEQPLRWLNIINPKLFTVVAKTVTMDPKVGNLSMWHPWTCVRPIKFGNERGATNAVGLTNPGIRAWVKDDYQVAKRMGYQVAASVKPENPAEAAEMAKLLEDLDLAYIEVNVSCPNVHDVPQDIPESLKLLNESGHPVVLKLSFDQLDPKFVAATEEFVEAYHAINTIPWDQVFPSKTSPIQKYKHGLKGGVSGDFITMRSRQAINYLWGVTTRPLIAGGGISSLDDVESVSALGAQAFSIGTLFLNRPWMPAQIVKDFHKRN